MIKKSIKEEVSAYYTDKINKFGETPEGVDWNGVDGQIERFFQLSRLIDGEERFSVNDLGCGYGSYYEYLKSKYSAFDYQGIDVSSSMISSAVRRNIKESNASFVVADKPTRVADYSIASGIFNVKQERSNDEWWDYISDTLKLLNEHSSKGFSFNCLTSFSDKERMKDYLYYANSMELFEFCKINFSRNVALLHDYDLYEFTIIVRK